MGRDEERFPDLAARLLEADPGVLRLDYEALVDDWLDPGRAAQLQLAPPTAFGQPGTTAHHGDGFVIELYFWLNSRSAIHDHPFCGVFAVLEGWSVHARYAVEELEPVGSRSRLVEARLDGLDLVRPGQVERFSLRTHPLVHALVHVPVPSISLVVRTTRTEGYRRYLPPSLSVPLEPVTEPLGGRLELLAALQAADDPRHAEFLTRELGRTSFETAVALLGAGWAGWGEQERQDYLEPVRRLHGPAADAIPKALDQAVRTTEASAVRESLQDPDLRLVATALAYAESRAQVLGLLEQHADPSALLHRFVDEAGLFAADEQASADIARALIDGADRPTTLARLEATYGAESVAAHAEPIERYRRYSIFSSLDVDPG